MTWGDKTTVKKGDIGEEIVDNYLRKRGYIPYAPNFDGAHPFDRLCASRDKKTIFVADAKAKAKRKHYPDTGIDIKHYKEYKFLSDKYKIDVYLFFVDEENKAVYGNMLRVLEHDMNVIHYSKKLKYPIRSNGIIYFPMASMKTLAELTDEQCAELKKYTTKKDAYKI